MTSVLDKSIFRNKIAAAKRRGWWFKISLLMLAVLSVPAAAFGQAGGQTRSYPNDQYYFAKDVYASGDYVDALKDFKRAGRSGLRSVNRRWVDSICYYTMVGECYYQMGNLKDALNQYDSALKVHLANDGWMLRLQFPPSIGPSSRRIRNPITWGSPKLAVPLGHVPTNILFRKGSNNINQLRTQGGVFSSTELFNLHASEVVRCSVLAMRRRLEIMGPTCKHDPLTGLLVESFRARRTYPNHWSQSWISLQLGLAYASDGNPEQAVPELNKALLVSGQYSHSLRSTALLELGKLAFAAEKFKAAANYFLEATYDASIYENYDVMEEGFRGAFVSHQSASQQGIFLPLAPAAAWALREKARPLQASLLISAAENALSLGDARIAASLLGRASQGMRRYRIKSQLLNIRLQYETARLNYQTGKVAAGDKALGSTMAMQRGSSLRLYQIALADAFFLSGALSERAGENLFAEVLREPTPEDWLTNPMETLSVVTVPHPAPMEHWFELTLARERTAPEKALEIADNIRRHKFYSSLFMGGRLLSLRWILEASEQSLPNEAVLQRQDLLLRYPDYSELSKTEKNLRDALAALPLVSEDLEVSQQQKKILIAIANISNDKELILRNIALRREPSAFVFPPRLDVKEVQSKMPVGQKVLTYFATSRALYAFSFDRDEYQWWVVDNPAALRKNIVTMLRDLGMHDKNISFSLEDLKDESWKESARKIVAQLNNNAKSGSMESVKEFVIVPDGSLWYLPFELLPVESKEGEQMLLSRVQIRYAPTVAMITPDGRPQKPIARTAVIAGKLFPRDEVQVAIDASSDLERVLPGTVRLPLKMAAPSSVLSIAFDRLVVLDDIMDKARTPYDWSLMRMDRGKLGSTLESWLSLPWGGPDQIVLPGFHTAAESSLKRGGSGDEMFYALCGMMSTGARTILISRWRTGGQTSFDIVREFTQELPHTSAAESFRRAARLTMQSQIDAELEPRVDIKKNQEEEALKAAHPLFWAGYMLVDNAGDPKQKDLPLVKPNAAIKKGPAKKLEKKPENKD